ncbi:MAG: ATP phosphoribosyltransferase regulatory subunit, partial [Methanomicrobiaceae archaeon]|nr:ATP phosphoribosyltransferase regulatory subunit [Methanomicrobiaceae archaeon]
VADCFRYERPQKGRYRQFWQFGAELIGADTAAADAEVVLLAGEVLGATGVSFATHVGHLAPMRRMLSDFDPAMQRRVMAFLDKRDMGGLADTLRALGQADLSDDLSALAASRELSEVFEITGPIPEQARIEETFALLDAAGMEYVPDFGIARGLDYYTGMVFECFAPNLGAENQVLGGGAYRLAHLFGGEDVPSAGFAIGFDRVAVSLGEFSLPRGPVVAVLYTPEARDYAFAIARAFRDAGIRTELNLSEKGIGAQMKHAGREMDYAVIAGERESASGTVTLRNLSSGEQKECTLSEAVAEVKGT